MIRALKEKKDRRALLRQFNGLKGRVKMQGIGMIQEGSANWPAWRFYNYKTEQFLMIFDPVLMRWWDGETTGYSLNVRDAVNRAEKLNRLFKKTLPAEETVGGEELTTSSAR